MLLTDCLVDAQNQAGGFCGGLQSVDLDQAGLPDKLLHVVRDALCLEVNTGPGVALPVLHTQPVQDVCGIDTGVVAQLPRDHLQRFCEGLDDGLLLVGNLCVGVVVQERRDLHLNSTASCYDIPVLDRALDDHDGIVQTALDLSNELLGTSTEDECACLGLGAALEEVETLSTNLSLLELVAGSEVLLADIRAGGLHARAGRTAHSVEVVGGHPSSAEDIAVGEVLCRKITDGQLAENNLGACLVQCLHLVVDDLPLSIDDGLVLGNLLNAYFGIVLLALELKLHVQAHNLGLAERLGLLLKPSI